MWNFKMWKHHLKSRDVIVAMDHVQFLVYFLEFNLNLTNHFLSKFLLFNQSSKNQILRVRHVIQKIEQF